MSVTDLGVLTRRQLNRALLARQLLLERVPRGALETVEHLVGLQAQAPFPPYYGLWSRLAGFRPEDLAALLTGRGVVRIALMRGTIHLVSARDCLPLRRLIQPVIDRMFRTNHGKRLPGVDLGELAAAGRELVESEPMTFGKLGETLAKRWPDHPPSDLAQGVRALVPLVQIPPRAVWGRAGQSLHTSAESWLGRPAATEPGLTEPDLTEPGLTEPGLTELDLRELVTRYLAAFGPATVRDIQAWSGLTGLRGVVETLRPALATFRSDGGAELFDLPDAPRPPGGTPAPVRLVAEFDNLLLSHADRTRIISEEHRGRLYTVNGIFPGTVLIDGFVAGMWRLIMGRGMATLTIEIWEPAAAAERDELITEGERLLAFAAPGDAHDIRFAPIATAAPRLPHPGPHPVEI
ncbi:MAG TPA: winged helix DNA-binding domain-containing protein [Streptosporangiaceae bacterium]